jgi:hypothetical protein
VDREAGLNLPEVLDHGEAGYAFQTRHYKENG